MCLHLSGPGCWRSPLLIATMPSKSILDDQNSSMKKFEPSIAEIDGQLNAITKADHQGRLARRLTYVLQFVFVFLFSP